MRTVILIGLIGILLILGFFLVYPAISPVIYKTIGKTSNKAVVHVYIADPPLQWPVNRVRPPETLPSRNVSRPFEINYAYIELTVKKIIFAGAGNQTVREVSINAKVKLTTDGVYVLLAENILVPSETIKSIHLVTSDIAIYLEDGSTLATRREVLPIHIMLEASVVLEAGKEYVLCVDICFQVPKVTQPPETPFAVVEGAVFATASVEEL